MKKIKLFSTITCAAIVFALAFANLNSTATATPVLTGTPPTMSKKASLKDSKPLDQDAKDFKKIKDQIAKISKKLKAKPFSTKQKLNLLKKLSKSLVFVNFEVSYDKKGEAPDVLGCIPESVSTLLDEDRPLQIPAYALSSDRLLIEDPNIPARYLKSIFLEHNGEKIKVSYEKFFIFGDYAIMKLAKPVKGLTPIKFSAKAKKAKFILGTSRWDDRRSFSFTTLMTRCMFLDSGEKILTRTPDGIVFNKNGVSAGLICRSVIPENYKWKGSPLKHKDVMTVKAWEKIAAQTSKTVLNNVYFATVHFRSPKKQQEHSDYSDSSTRVETLAIKSPNENMVIILSEFNAKRTALMTKIVLKVTQPDGKLKKVNAKFKGSLKDYGCFVATVEEKLPGGNLNWAKPDYSFKNIDHLQPGAEIRFQGNKLEYFYHRMRITDTNIGWKNHVYPSISAELGHYTLLFSKNGKSLETLPISRRLPDTGDSWGRGGETVQTFASDIAKVFKNLDKHIDKSNIPLAENKEKRLAWMGLILQPMDYELARMMKITDETNGGCTGAMVSYVYPNSPAAKAGIKAGDFFLRLHVEGKKEPVDISVSEPVKFATYYWNVYDEIPESYFDEMPSPWIPIENDFTSMLTNLGIGKKFSAEFIIDGKKVKKEFKVTECPKHFGIAESFKSKALGITVKDITIELRRYFQMKADAPGVIISNIKPGTIASIAGLKPYEIITEVNGTPVKTVKEFEKLISKGGEFKFAVKRWIKGRMVKVEIPKK